MGRERSLLPSAEGCFGAGLLCFACAESNDPHPCPPPAAGAANNAEPAPRAAGANKSNQGGNTAPRNYPGNAGPGLPFRSGFSTASHCKG